MQNSGTAKLTIIVSNAILKWNEFIQFFFFFFFQSAHVVAVSFNLIADIYWKVNNVGESLSSTSSYAILLARRLSRRRPPRAYRHWQNRSSVEEMRGSVRSGGGGTTRVRRGRTATDADDAVAAATSHHRVYVPSPLCNATFDHNTRHTTFPQHDAAATNVPARGSFVASHRGPDVAVFVLVRRVRVVVVPRRIDIYVCMRFSMSVDDEEVGDRVDRRGESRRQWTCRDDLSTQSLTVGDVFPSSIPSGNSRGRSCECILGKGEAAGGGRKRSEKKFSWDSDWIDLGRSEILLQRSIPITGMWQNNGGGTSRNVNPVKNPSRAKKHVEDDLRVGVVINTSENKREILKRDETVNSTSRPRFYKNPASRNTKKSFEGTVL